MIATFFKHGQGRSRNARLAETDGRMPLTRAAQSVKEWLGCTIAVAKAALDLLHDGEWHHVGKFATQVKYYDAENFHLKSVVRQIDKVGLKKWTQLRAAKRAFRSAFGSGVYQAPRIVDTNRPRFVAMQARKRAGTFAEGEYTAIYKAGRAND